MSGFGLYTFYTSPGSLSSVRGASLQNASIIISG
ncbi:MAG: hypothetical protein JWO80_5000, partial [Bryobacterales bacterium]|nr:hypothetical protein [Bryobacterales bacterium]